MTIKALFLDFYGTVVHEDEEIISTITKLIQSSSAIVNISTNDISKYWWDEFFTLFSTSFGDHFKTQRELEAIALSNTINSFKAKLNVNELCELMFLHWMSPAIFDDATDFFNLNTLPVYILSNIDRVDIMKAISFHQLHVHDVITSDDAKSYKPRPEMFNLALQKCGLKAEEVLHVGDSLISDIRGSEQIGIKNVWINRYNKSLKEGISPTYTITKLTELLTITHQL